MSGEIQSAWVIGASGLLGQALVGELWRAGFEVIETASETDVRDAAALRAAVAGQQPTLVFNAAAFTAVDAAEHDPETAWAINATGAGHVALLARELGADLVHFSTDYVHDREGPEPIPEDAEPAPLNVYGASKLAGEKLVLATMEPPGSARRVFVVRTSWLFGPGRPNFVQMMLELMQTRERLEVVADQFGRPTSARDLAEAVVRLCEPGPEAGIYHIANAGIASWHGFAETIRARAEAFGLALKVQDIKAISSEVSGRAARRPVWSVLGSEKFDRWYRMRSWQLALDAYLDEIINENVEDDAS